MLAIDLFGSCTNIDRQDEGCNEKQHSLDNTLISICIAVVVVIYLVDTVGSNPRVRYTHCLEEPSFVYIRSGIYSRSLRAYVLYVRSYTSTLYSRYWRDEEGKGNNKMAMCRMSKFLLIIIHVRN